MVVNTDTLDGSPYVRINFNLPLCMLRHSPLNSLGGCCCSCCCVSSATLGCGQLFLNLVDSANKLGDDVASRVKMAGNRLDGCLADLSGIRRGTCGAPLPGGRSKSFLTLKSTPSLCEPLQGPEKLFSRSVSKLQWNFLKFAPLPPQDLLNYSGEAEVRQSS